MCVNKLLSLGFKFQRKNLKIWEKICVDIYEKHIFSKALVCPKTFEKVNKYEA